MYNGREKYLQIGDILVKILIIWAISSVFGTIYAEISSNFHKIHENHGFLEEI